MTENFILGKVKNPKHIDALTNMAYWLDQNKFSCTFSIVKEMAMLDVEPYPENKVSNRKFACYLIDFPNATNEEIMKNLWKKGIIVNKNTIDKVRIKF